MTATTAPTARVLIDEMIDEGADNDQDRAMLEGLVDAAFDYRDAVNADQVVGPAADRLVLLIGAARSDHHHAGVVIVALLAMLTGLSQAYDATPRLPWVES